MGNIVIRNFWRIYSKHRTNMLQRMSQLTTGLLTLNMTLVSKMMKVLHRQNVLWDQKWLKKIKILGDRRVEVKYIAKIVDMSTEHVHHILHVELSSLSDACCV